MCKGLEKCIHKEPTELMNKIQAAYECLINEDIKNKEIVTVCCVYGLVEVPGEKGTYIKYEFKEPYNRISHGYSPKAFEEKMQEMRDMFPNIK